ncbi:MAG: hypothetical protein ACRDM7_07745 [Thermoleophilaceae bacterium]
MALPERRVGMLERNLALFPGWQLGRQPHRGRIERVDFLGAIASVERAQLGEIELDVLSWLTAEWWEQGASVDGITRFTWYRFGQDMWGAAPSGRHRALLQEAIDNLMGAVVTLSGFDAHTGELTPALFSDVHLLRSVVRPRPRGARSDPALDGGKREDTVEVRLEDWIVAQLLGDYRLVLDWQVQRQLTGAAKRLWYYLGARASDFATTSWPSEAQLEVELTDALLEGLSLTGARARDRRAALARAGGRIVRADPRYLQVDVDRDGEAVAGYRLRAVRRDPEPPGDVLEATATPA